MPGHQQRKGVSGVDLGLIGKFALVTGGSKGIGFACAKALAKEGCRVAIVSRSRENVDRACSVLPGAKGLCADLADPRAAAALVRKVQDEVGPIDILGCGPITLVRVVGV
jgi:NAD(P)-dependent dehydrogenase (short-subunit alcohol dehydrogenase family)